ncbi:MAG: hypothetical protein QW607_05105 [Desulfurococcaceae archaeon]
MNALKCPEYTTTYFWDSSISVVIDIESAMRVFITAYGNGLSIINENIEHHVSPYYLFKLLCEIFLSMSLMRCSIIDVLTV